MLGADQTLELLDRLKTTVRDFAAREARLEHDYRLKSTAAQKHLDAAGEELEGQVAAEISQAESAYAAGQEVLRGRYEQRRSLIGRALKSSKKLSLERIDGQEGQRKYELQKETLETHRQHDADLVANDANLAEFQRQLAENREAFAALEVTTSKAFSGYARFQRLLSDAGGPAPDLSRDEYKLLEELNALHAEITRELARFKRRLIPIFFRFFPIWLLVPLVLIGHGALVALPYFKINVLPNLSTAHIVASGVVSLVLVLALYFQGKRSAGAAAARIAAALERARKMYNACLEKSAERHKRSEERRVGKECRRLCRSRWSPYH
jgi:hypothetical protein